MLVVVDRDISAGCDFFCTKMHCAVMLAQNKDSTGDEKLTPKQLGDYYVKMTEDFPIVSIEDAFDQACPYFVGLLLLQT